MNKKRKVVFTVRDQEMIILTVDDYVTPEKIAKFKSGLAFEFEVEMDDVEVTFVTFSGSLSDISISCILTFDKKYMWN